MTQPVHFEVIPPSQLLITPGHLGILDRFRETTVMASSLPALFAGWEIDLSDAALQKRIKTPGTTCKVAWGFWVDWEDPGNPVWRCEITADGKRMTPPQPLTLGPLAGSCPLVVGRFKPQPQKPWGRGAGWAALPDMRVLDMVADTTLGALDQALMNTLIYGDDGGLDLSEGIQAGRAYPAGRQFRAEQVLELGKNVNVEQGWFTEERLTERLMSIFYQDGPRQRGDTPPTAAQWLDERRRVQARLGKPSAPLFSEFIAPMVQRVEYLLVRAGKLPNAITHNEQELTIQPISPLMKAQNQDKVMVSRSNLDMAFSVLQDQAGTVVDMVATMKNIVKASGDELTVIRDEQEMPPDATAPAPV
jgi:hypothetical protein